METIKLTLEIPAELASAITGLLKSLQANIKTESKSEGSGVVVGGVVDVEDNIPVPVNAEEVEAFCKERNLIVSGRRFFNFYNDRNWYNTNGKPVKNWKELALMWDEEDRKRTSKKDPLQGSYDMMRDWANK